MGWPLLSMLPGSWIVKLQFPEMWCHLRSRVLCTMAALWASLLGDVVMHVSGLVILVVLYRSL